MKFNLLLLACLALACSNAAETRFWQQTDQSDFEKGTLTDLSLRSDGRLFLAPEFRAVYDPSTAYLWALASDSKGTLYAGGGGSSDTTARLFVIDPQGKGRTLAEFDALEIHAIAIDRGGQIYVATDPDGKVYKVSPQGKSQLFFDPHEKYIWALAFNSQGDLFIATGDQGNVYRVTPDGHGAVFFKTEETHARSMVVDARDNLVVGTEPGGLIMRISPEAKGFVLYQTPKREVTAVAVSKSGEIYAAAVGTRSAAPQTVSSSSNTTSTAATSTTAIVAATTAPTATAPKPAAASSTFTATPAPISGGSEVYRINTDNSPRKIWSNTQDIVYAIGFDSAGRPLFATGNRGDLYRFDSDVLSTLLITASPTQLTNFVTTPAGRSFVATGNIGRVYELGQRAAAKGVFESDVLDAGSFSYWGRVSFRGTPASVTIQTRSGNVNRPEDKWSSWAPLRLDKPSGEDHCGRCLNGRVTSPSARFLQYKINVAAGDEKITPEIASIEVAHLAKNLAPVVEEIEVTPPNYKFPAPSSPPSPSTSVTLPPLGQKRRTSSGLTLDLGSSQTLTYAKGMIGARWMAADENGDSLVYSVDIRGSGETSWNLLKDKLRDKYFSWDSTAFPDGEYQLRVTAADSPANPPAEALTSVLVSEPFLIDNTPPRILNLAASPSGNKIEVHWKALDARSIIDKAEYSVNGGDWLPVQPTTRLSDSQEEDYSFSFEPSGHGEQTVAVRVSDSYDNQAVDKVVVK